MERKLSLEIEELEERIAPTCILETPGGKELLPGQVPTNAAEAPVIDCRIIEPPR